ncbi:ABC transporter substrate-binding protein [Pimelobacter simplex]|uniref:ABC transporter substrate-binding protein n=1 Tax=Nocardioides simplex TaxID=2045 RepID=UPI003AB00D64
MKHLLTGTAVAALLAVGLSACTNASTDPGATGGVDVPDASDQVDVATDQAAADLLPADIAKTGTIKVAMDASYPPFEMFAPDNKTIVGFDADFATAVAQKLGLKVELVNAGFDTILTGLAAGRYDLAESSFSITPERQQVVDFVTYLQGGAGIAVRPGNPEDLSMDPMVLCGHKIAAQKGTTQAIEQLPAIRQQCIDAGKEPVEPELFPSQNDAILALNSGRVDGMMADSTAISYQGALAGGKFELAPGDIYESRPTGIALPKDSPLRAAVAAAVTSLYDDGTVATLTKKWNIPDTNLAPNPGS